MDKHDVTIVGAGLNGLICAAYLAKAGKSVVVLAHSTDGASDYSEGWTGRDGYVFPTPANDLKNFPRQILWDLDLVKHGLALEAHAARAVISRENGSIIQDREPRDMDRRLRSISSGQADAYRNFRHLIIRQRRYLDQFVDQKDGRMPKRQQVMPLLTAAGQDGLLEAAQLYTSSLRDVLDKAFDAEDLKLLFLAGALEGPFGAMGLGPLSPTSAFGLLFDPMTLAGAPTDALEGTIAGGTAKLIEILRKVLKDMGVTFVVDAEVAKIEHHKGTIKGISLAGDQFIESTNVLCDIDIKRVLFGLLDWKELPEEIVGDVATFRSSAQVAQINFTLKARPEANGLYEGFLAEGGVLHIIESVLAVEEAFDAWKEGRLAPEAPIEFRCLPHEEGKHAHALARLHFAPGAFAGGEWDDKQKTRVIGEAVARLAAQMPGFDKLIEDVHIMTPVEMETGFGLIGGHHKGGATALDQLLFNRPNPLMADGLKVRKGLSILGPSHSLAPLYEGRAGYIMAKALSRSSNPLARWLP